MPKNGDGMYIVRRNKETSAIKPLRELLLDFMSENDISVNALADEIKVNNDTLRKFLDGEAVDLKFMQAIRLMKLLGLSEGDFVSVYCNGKDTEEEGFERLERLSYISKNFDLVALKKLGIIPKTKVEEYEKYICSFLGINSIYEYDDTSLMPTLFSKSKRKVLEEKESKMTSFWLKCAIQSFLKIGNPNEFDRDLLLQLLRRSAVFTEDEKNGYYRFVLVLYQIGITVLTQSYATGTNAHGATLILNSKPCIIVTDMGKKYHKLWLSLLHELYHVVNDFDIIETLSYHFSTPNMPDLLLNEQKADQFALDILINPTIQEKLGIVVSFPAKVKALAKELHVSPSIIYGVYLELLPKGKMKNQQFARFNKEEMLITTEIATKNILFDPISKRSLTVAIDEMKSALERKVI